MEDAGTGRWVVAGTLGGVLEPHWNPAGSRSSGQTEGRGHQSERERGGLKLHLNTGPLAALFKKMKPVWETL